MEKNSQLLVAVAGVEMSVLNLYNASVKDLLTEN